MVPLLFICISQCRPLQVNNPIRYNRRSLSQPYPNGSVRRSEAIFHSLHASFLSAIVELTTGMFSVKHPKIYSLRHCIFIYPFLNYVLSDKFAYFSSDALSLQRSRSGTSIALQSKPSFAPRNVTLNIRDVWFATLGSVEKMQILWKHNSEIEVFFR